MRTTTKSIERAVFVVALLATALMTLPFRYAVPGFGLDRSHIFGSNYLANAGYEYGADFVFTYGPLGFVNNPEPVANNIPIANLICGAVWLILLFHLARLARGGRRGLLLALLLMSALFAVGNPIAHKFDYFTLVTLLVVVVSTIERPEGWISYVCMIVIVAVASLTRFTAYLLAIPTASLYVAARVGWPPKLPEWKDRLFVAAILAAPPVAFFTFQAPSPTSFWKYIYGSFELSAGYSEAMSIPTGFTDVCYGAFLAGLFGAGLLYGMHKRVLLWTHAPVLAILYWMTWKHGFVRSDGHVINSYMSEVVLAACLICLLKGGREAARYAIVFPGFVFVALMAINAYSPLWNTGYWSAADQRRMASGLLHWNETAARLDVDLKKHDWFRRLPADFQQRLKGSTTTVFPWELSYATTQLFRLDPLYVMQAYSGYTEYLDRMTAQRIRERCGRDDYILFEWKTIDGRHPLLDVPATWQAMADCYRPELAEDNRLLLIPRKSPLQHRQTFVTRTPVPFGQWVELPRTESILWSKIHIPHSIRGGGVGFLYKLPAMWLTLGMEAGKEPKFRVIPAVLNSPFPISALPMDFNSLAQLWQSGKADGRVARIRLDTDAPADYGEPSMELFAETDAGER